MLYLYFGWELNNVQKKLIMIMKHILKLFSIMLDLTASYTENRKRNQLDLLIPKW
jgi:hypothetical protein